jgi:hypothetical protein
MPLFRKTTRRTNNPIIVCEHYEQSPNKWLRACRSPCLMWQRLWQVFRQASTASVHEIFT